MSFMRKQPFKLRLRFRRVIYNDYASPRTRKKKRDPETSHAGYAHLKTRGRPDERCLRFEKERQSPDTPLRDCSLLNVSLDPSPVDP